MRADTLQQVTDSTSWDQVDTDAGFRGANRLWTSAAFRLKAGPLVRRINRDVIQQTNGRNYDLVWVDKSVYLWRNTVDGLRKSAKVMVHFTPDTAFHANRSRHFFASASRYDLLVTTKSFEVKSYRRLAGAVRVMLVTQAYDDSLHRSTLLSAGKRSGVVFIGLCESDREKCIETLLAAGLPVRVGGRGWDRFVKKHVGSHNFTFLGNTVFGDQYAREYCTAQVGLGLLSKRFPELHTTRTFEIPACGAALATERTADTEEFFRADDVIFFDNYAELAGRLCELLDRPEQLEKTAQKGHQRVVSDGYSYRSVLSKILASLPFAKRVLECENSN
jgi:spore maturation protein CgeB